MAQDPTSSGQKERTRISAALILILVAVIAVAAYFLALDLRGFQASESTNARPHRLRDILNREPPGKPTVDSISNWMTFEYLDRIFGMPPAYLRDTLDIADVHYPRLSIRRYALDARISDAAAVERVKTAVRGFLLLTPAQP